MLLTPDVLLEKCSNHFIDSNLRLCRFKKQNIENEVIRNYIKIHGNGMCLYLPNLQPQTKVTIILTQF